MTGKISIGIFILAIVATIVAACLCLFLPSNPKDYSYLENFPVSQRLELSDEVKVENIDELYYSYETDIYGNPTRFYIHDKFEEGYGEGRFIFSYQNMQLNFEYEIEIVEVGSAYNHDEKDTASILRITSLDDQITGSMLVKIGTEEMLMVKRAEGMYWWFLIGCSGVALLLAVVFTAIDGEGLFDISKVTVQKVKYCGSVKRRIQRDFDLEKSENNVYKEFLNGTLSQIFTFDNMESKNNMGNKTESKNSMGNEEEWVRAITVKKSKLAINWGWLLKCFMWFIANVGFMSAVATFFFGAVAGWAWFFLIPLVVAIIDIIVLLRFIY